MTSFDGSFYAKELIKDFDPEVFSALSSELERQEMQIEMIASENIVSPRVLSTMGSIFTNKYAEGYPGRRYYGGCKFADQVEQLAIDRICKLFSCNFANVQPHSGAQANFAVFYALLQPGDTFMGMDLSMGGHLTHGSKVSVSGKWFNAVSYGLTKEGFIDYDQVEKLALEYNPKLIICGASAYSRKIDFAKMREIADKVGAYLMADVAHYAGLIVTDYYPSPFPHSHVVTSTTHKTLRGPRGGIILTNDEKLAKKINSAVFPGIQGGPQIHSIAGKAVAFLEALQPSFKEYIKNVVFNAQSVANYLMDQGLNVLSKGTDSHMLIVDLRGTDVTGQQAEIALEKSGITCNKNSIPYDPLPPMQTSGIRLGTPAATTRGLSSKDFLEVGEIISTILKQYNSGNIDQIIKDMREKTYEICKRIPLFYN